MIPMIISICFIVPYATVHGDPATLHPRPAGFNQRGDLRIPPPTSGRGRRINNRPFRKRSGMGTDSRQSLRSIHGRTTWG